MLISYNWLQEYFADALPAPEKLAELLTFHAFEVEEVRESSDDTVIDIDVLPNRRFDCLGHRGIAKEISVITGIPLSHDPLNTEPELSPETNTVSVVVDTPAKCPRYAAAHISGVVVGESPEWLQQRLAALGQKSINNIVDATNYVMFNLGQPLHAFDAGKIGTNDAGAHAIQVRSAHDGEEITVLGGESYTLSESDLLITDGIAGTPIGIAGVKGGTAAEVTKDTTDIILESANFNATAIRKTSTQIGLRTDASVRFESGLSPRFAGYGINAVARLITDIAGGELRGYVDAYPEPAHPYVLGVTHAQVNGLLGTDMSDEDIKNILNRFGITWELVSNPRAHACALAEQLVGAAYIPVGRIRFDAPEQFSCSSLTNYVYAHAGVPLPSISIDQYAYGAQVSREELQPGDLIFANSGMGSIRYATEGFMAGTEVPAGVDHVGIYVGDDMVIHASKKHGAVVKEPLSESSGFAQTVGYARVGGMEPRYAATIPFERGDLRIPEDLIEEIGRIYGYENVAAAPLPDISDAEAGNTSAAQADRIRDALIRTGYSEVYTYALQSEGVVKIMNPLSTDKAYMRPSLIPGMRDALINNVHKSDLLGVEAIHIFEIGTIFPGTDDERNALAIGCARRGKKASVSADIDAALSALSDVLGVDVSQYITEQISDEQFSGADIRGCIGLVHIDLDTLLKNHTGDAAYTPQTHIQADAVFHSLSPYPFVTRDIAVWMPAGSESDSLLSVIRETAGELLAGWRLFDTYEADGRVSYAFRLAFQSHEKTLTDEEVNAAMDRVQETISKQEGGEIR